MDVKTLKDGIAWWQSKSFHVARKVGGKLIDEDAGPSRPKEFEFIKGGKRPAMDRARQLWGDALVVASGIDGTAAVRAKAEEMAEWKAKSDGEDEGAVKASADELKGPVIEPEDDVEISERPTRISRGHGSFSGLGRSERLTARTPRLS